MVWWEEIARNTTECSSRSQHATLACAHSWNGCCARGCRETSREALIGKMCLRPHRFKEFGMWFILLFSMLQWAWTDWGNICRVRGKASGWLIWTIECKKPPKMYFLFTFNYFQYFSHNGVSCKSIWHRSFIHPPPPPPQPQTASLNHQRWHHCYSCWNTFESDRSQGRNSWQCNDVNLMATSRYILK